MHLAMDILPGKRGQHRIKSLLLLVNLFVARTLGDCPKPVLAENIVLTNEALLMNEFPDNVEITLTCANGYVKDSGSGTMTCTNGAWGDLDLACKKKDCGPPLPQPFMSFNLSQGTLFGATAKVICDKGYLVKGSGFKHCYNAGWTGKSTKCEIVTCTMPEKIANGMNLWDSEDSPKYGENVQFFCNEGFTLTGKDSIMCTEYGVYDFSSPQCVGDTKEEATTKLVTLPTSTTTPPTQETSASSTASATQSHRDSTHTASATPPVSLSARGGDHFTSEDKTTSTTSQTPPYYSQGGQNGDVIETNKDGGYTPVIISVVCVSIAVCVVVLFIHRLLLKRKGSYDTREDLKHEELLPFQNL